MTNAEAWFSKSLRPRKPEGSLGRTAQDRHLDFHTAPERLRSSSFAATPQSDVVGIWSRDLGVMATLSVRQKMPFLFVHL